MTFLKRLALPALAVLLSAPVAMHAQTPYSSSSGTGNAGANGQTTGPTGSAEQGTTPQTPTKKSHHRRSRATNSDMNTTSQPMPDSSMQTPATPSTAKPGTDPVNPTSSPEPPVPTTQGPPPPATTPNTNQAAPH